MYLRARRKHAPLLVRRMWSGGFELEVFPLLFVVRCTGMFCFPVPSEFWKSTASAPDIKTTSLHGQIHVSSFTYFRVWFHKGPITLLSPVQVHTCKEKHVCGSKNCCKFSEGEEHYSQKGMKMNDCCNGLVMTTTITRKSSFQTHYNPINALICWWEWARVLKMWQFYCSFLVFRPTL